MRRMPSSPSPFSPSKTQLPLTRSSASSLPSLSGSFSPSSSLCWFSIGFHSPLSPRLSLSLWSLLLISLRLSHRILKTDGVPVIGHLIQPTLTALFVGLSFFFTSGSVQRYLLGQLLSFWSGLTVSNLRRVVCSPLSCRTDGCLGLPWLGKVYFLLSVGLSLLVTYRYGFFEEGTFSHALLRLLLRSLGGVLMLLRCSPNPDICVALGMAALMRDHILDWSHYLWITLEAAKQTPSSQLSGQRPLTADDFAHQGQVHTTAALRELREYLLTPEGKAQAAKVNWRSVLLLVLDLASPHLTLCPL
jgi:hypothetical protein